GGDLNLRMVRADLTGSVPYPEAKAALAGPLDLTLGLKADTLQASATDLQGLEASGRLKAQILAAAGETLPGLTGTLRLSGRADAVQGATLDARAVRFELASAAVTSDPEAGTLTLEASDPLRVRAMAVRQDGLFIEAPDLSFDTLGVTRGPKGLTAALSGSGRARRAERPGLAVQSPSMRLKALFEQTEREQISRVTADLSSPSARVTGLGAPKAAPAGDSWVALQNALGDFSVEAKGLEIVARQSEASPLVWRLTSQRPVVLYPAKEAGRVTLSAVAGSPLLDSEGPGAVRVTMAGGDLPQGTLTATEISLTDPAAPDGLSAQIATDLSFSTGPLRGAHLEGVGTLRTDPGGLRVLARDCLSVSAEALEAGAQDLSRLTTKLCPVADAPLVQSQSGRLTVMARLDQAEAHLADSQLAFREGRARVQLEALGDRLSGTVQLDGAQVADLTPAARFNPLEVKGTVTVDPAAVKAKLDVADLLRRHLGTVTVTHATATGRGEALIRAPELNFTPEGLQPAALSPLAASLTRSDVKGQAQFEGAVRWTPKDVTSQGLVTLGGPSGGGLDFTGPMGPVRGLSGTLRLTSLSPLMTAPGQSLSAQAIDGALPLTALLARFQLLEKVLQLDTATVKAAGGSARIEAVSIPLDPKATFAGTLVLEQIDLSQVLAASPLAKDVRFTGRVSGRLPFTYGPDGLRFQAGTLSADGPGRLSISRAALSGVQAGGGPETDKGAVPPSTVQDMAYQAMENLAFDSLSAEVNSLPGGRLGVLFRIKGRHDPPQRQVARIS
ncbi:MAG: YdbH domain-containing protein, partial [Asticcacaulis sp.]